MAIFKEMLSIRSVLVCCPRRVFIQTRSCDRLLLRQFGGSAATKSKSGLEVDLKFLEDDQAGVAVIEMNRPHARNSLGKTFVHQFTQHLDHVARDRSLSALVVRSKIEKIFCAGADLKERAKMSFEEVAEFVKQLRAFTSKLENVPIPTIAAIDGIAVGGGLEMALACDMRTASTTAKMGLVESTLAIIPGAGGTQRLPRTVSVPLAKEMIFTGKLLDGAEALEACLVNHAVEQNAEGDAAYKKALDITKVIVKNGPIALRMAKIAINKGMEVDINTGLAVEEMCYAQVIPTKDRLEGLVAFKEKRRPVYKGE